ncbi:MAG TPA: hypothetical protein VH298_17265 [Jatrophihabitans sp.]|nr:hypothetical protein [Jatrophihabitans sp.]
MLHPVGTLPPSVYWRRRLLLLVAALLAGLSSYAIFFRGGGNQAPRSGSSFSSPAGSSSQPQPPASSDSTGTSSSSVASSATSSSPASTKTCQPGQLTVAAATNAASYPAGAKPQVAIVVTNRGPAPCVQDLADSQIELRVYNGSARVWGSHDCQIQPGTSLATLPVGQQIRRAVEWSGLSSRPGCAGVRTRVGAGTYTLYAYLAGHAGATSRFSLAG